MLRLPVTRRALSVLGTPDHPPTRLSAGTVLRGQWQQAAVVATAEIPQRRMERVAPQCSPNSQSVPSHGGATQQPHCVYLLRSLAPASNATYCGITRPARLAARLQQHNGDAKGGARATRMGRPWKYLCVLHGFPDRVSALQCEWRLKHWDGRRTPARRPEFSGGDGRLRVLNHVLCSSDTWTADGKAISVLQLRAHVDPENWGLFDMDAIAARQGSGCVALQPLSDNHPDIDRTEPLAR